MSEARKQEQADQLISAINRLAAALEQANAKPPVVGTIQTAGAVTPLQFKHYYGQTLTAETPPDEQRPSKQRRPRQSSRS